MVRARKTMPARATPWNWCGASVPGFALRRPEAGWRCLRCSTRDSMLLNTAVARAREPVTMARALRAAAEAGRAALLAGRIPRKFYAEASSPMEGRIGPTVESS